MTRVPLMNLPGDRQAVSDVPYRDAQWVKADIMLTRFKSVSAMVNKTARQGNL